MSRFNAHDARFTVIVLRGMDCLFTESRIWTNTVPKPFWKYEIRHADEHCNAYISESVGDCFFGTIITPRALNFKGKNVISLDYGEIDFYAGSETSLKSFAKERGIVTRPGSGGHALGIALVDFSDDCVGDERHGYHLSLDGRLLMKDDQYIDDVYEKLLQTDKFSYFGYDGECVMFSTAPDGTIDELVSDNSFAQTGFLNSMEAVLARTGEETVLFMDEGTRACLDDFVRNYEWDAPGVDATSISFSAVLTQGTRSLFTERTVSPGTVPKALHVYEIDGDPANPEGKMRLSKRAYLNFQGTLITERPLDLGTDDAIYMEPKDVGLRSDMPVKLKDFARECGVHIKPPKDRER